MYNLSHVKTERTYTPAQLQTLVKSCQLSSVVFTVWTTISNTHRSHHHHPYPESEVRNCIASSLVRNPSRCFVKRSAVLFFVSTRLTASNVVASGFLDDFHCVLLHRLPYCDHLRLSSCSARWYASSSTLNARCPATGMDESAEEDHPYTFPTGKLSVSKSSLCRRHSIEVCPTRLLDHPYSFCRVVSRGDQQEVMNLGLAALDSPLETVSRLSHSCRMRSLRIFIRVRDLILEVHLRTVNFPVDMT